MSTLIAKFSELKDGDKFLYKATQYIKVAPFQIDQPNCCNYSRKTLVNAKKRDGNYVFFLDDEEVILQF